MTAPTLTLAQIRKLKPCTDDWTRVQALLEAHGKGPYSAVDAKAAGVVLDDLIWIATQVAKTDKDVDRRLCLWAYDCAAHVLRIYERQHPNDRRVSGAIVAARAYARGEIDAAAGDAARAAARAAAWDAAWAAAGAAACAAARAARDAAEAAAWDDAWAAAGDDAWDAEKKWQFDRLVAWLSDPEPKDWPLTQKEAAA